MAWTRSWIIDSRGFADKVRNAALPSAHQIKDCEAFRECPNCHHLIDNKNAMKSKTEGLHALPSDDPVGNDAGAAAWLAGESQAVDGSDWDCLDESLLCSENINSSAPRHEPSLDGIAFDSFGCIANEVNRNNMFCGIADLQNLEMDSPPDFQLSNLQFSSQDSVFNWIDKL